MPMNETELLLLKKNRFCENAGGRVRGGEEIHPCLLTGTVRLQNAEGS